MTGASSLGCGSSWTLTERPHGLLGSFSMVEFTPSSGPEIPPAADSSAQLRSFLHMCISGTGQISRNCSSSLQDSPFWPSQLLRTPLSAPQPSEPDSPSAPLLGYYFPTTEVERGAKERWGAHLVSFPPLKQRNASTSAWFGFFPGFHTIISQTLTKFNSWFS